MKEVIISVPEEEYGFVMKLLSRLEFIKVKETSPSKREFLEGLHNAVEEVNEIKQGKKRGQSLQSFLDEI